MGLVIVGVVLTKKSPAPQVTSTPDITVDSSILYEIAIPKIAIKAPILLNVPAEDETAYLKALEGGVAHYNGTAVPGQTGNSVIFAHSGYYKNKPGDYKEIFRHLDQLRPGDDILTTIAGKKLNYKVTKSTIVAADDLSVIEPVEGESRLTLLTCWPPGTLDKRFVVTATLEK